ncbi:MAG: hypothetical protein AAGE96_08160 [Cyanobacteria bacterium P01_G01_bin.19]
MSLFNPTDSYSFLNAQKCLIEPFERLNFIVGFILLSASARIISTIFFLSEIITYAWGNPILYKTVAGFVTGTLTGVFQWLILRQYIPSCKWIVVVAINFVLTAFIRAIFLSRWILIISSNIELLPTKFWLIIGAEIIISIGLALLAGYLQWYVLRPYIVKARWWIFIPLTVMLVSGLIFILSAHSYFLIFDMGIVRLTIFPATQAICFCILHKKSLNDSQIMESPLAKASDVSDYWKVRKLRNILNKILFNRCRADRCTFTGKFKYLVGVSENDFAIAYEPMNQTSLDNIAQTPLLAASKCYSINSNSKDTARMAKFQVEFSPFDDFKICSWRTLPLIWFGIIIYIAILLVSFLAILSGVSLWFLANLLPYFTANLLI